MKASPGSRWRPKMSGLRQEWSCRCRAGWYRYRRTRCQAPIAPEPAACHAALAAQSRLAPASLEIRSIDGLSDAEAWFSAQSCWLQKAPEIGALAPLHAIRPEGSRRAHKPAERADQAKSQRRN